MKESLTASRAPTSPTMLAYMAGIIDGEGCIYGLCKMRGSALHTVLKVSVLMCSRATVEWIHTNFGGCLYSLPKRDNRPDRFLWQIANSHVIPVLRAILPYMIEKREQAETALKLAALLGEHGNHSGTFRKNESRVPQDNVNERIHLCTQLKQLKRTWKAA